MQTAVLDLHQTKDCMLVWIHVRMYYKVNWNPKLRKCVCVCVCVAECFGDAGVWRERQGAETSDWAGCQRAGPERFRQAVPDPSGKHTSLVEHEGLLEAQHSITSLLAEMRVAWLFGGVSSVNVFLWWFVLFALLNKKLPTMQMYIWMTRSVNVIWFQTWINC